MFQTTYDEQTAGRSVLYPKVQDANFLGYDRSLDRWKVDASGINIYASGISVELDYANDSVTTYDGLPINKNLIKKRVFYNSSGEISEIREAHVATPSGSACVVKLVNYDGAGEIDYIIESLGAW